ncbi:hypothetical protein Tco_1498073, partial [Tanacetum coccineum]
TKPGGLLMSIHGLFSGRNCCLVRRITCGYQWTELEGKRIWHVKGHRVLVMRDRMGIFMTLRVYTLYFMHVMLTPLCCDDIHDVTPRVSAYAGCDRLISEPLVIENILAMFFPTRKKSCWGTVFPTGLKRYKEPLVEPKEIG